MEEMATEEGKEDETSRDRRVGDQNHGVKAPKNRERSRRDEEGD